MTKLSELLKEIKILVIDDKVNEKEMISYLTDLKTYLKKRYRREVVFERVDDFDGITKIKNFIDYDMVLLDLKFDSKKYDRNYRYKHAQFLLRGKESAGSMIFEYIRRKENCVPIIIFSDYDTDKIKDKMKDYIDERGKENPLKNTIEFTIVCKKDNQKEIENYGNIEDINGREFVYYLTKIYQYAKKTHQEYYLTLDGNRAYSIPKEIDSASNNKRSIETWLNKVIHNSRYNEEDTKEYNYVVNNNQSSNGIKKIGIELNDKNNQDEKAGKLDNYTPEYSIEKAVSKYLDVEISTKNIQEIGNDCENEINTSEEERKDKNFDIWCAAIPLSAYNIEDKNKNEAYYNKLIALDKMGFDKIVLKTVYMEEDNEQPSDKAKLLSASRVYSHDKEKYNLYNTGKTAKENLFPDELSKFLVEKVNNNNNGLSKKLVISLGSHSDKPEIWENLFKTMFKKGDKDINRAYKTIEINARHAIRGITKKYTREDDDIKRALIGLDEYFISPDIGTFNGVWTKIKDWLELINKLGREHKKEIIIKLPYRSDINIIAFLINEIYEKNLKESAENTKQNESNKSTNSQTSNCSQTPNLKQQTSNLKGICGISLINTIKTPFDPSGINSNKRPLFQLQNRDMSKGDFINLPQYSGEDLGFLRNMAIYTVKNILNEKIKIYAIGGIVNEGDIKECINLDVDGAQLSTIALTNLKKTRELLNANYKKEANQGFPLYKRFKETRNIKLFVKREIHWDEFKCTKCGKCVTTAYCDAIMNKFTFLDDNNPTLPRNYPVFNKSLCTGCGMCVSRCNSGALKLVLKKTYDDVRCSICEAEKKQIYDSIANTTDGRKQYYCENCDSMLIEYKKEDKENKNSVAPLYLNGMDKEKIVKLGEDRENENTLAPLYLNVMDEGKIIKLDDEERKNIYTIKKNKNVFIITFDENINYISQLKIESSEDITSVSSENCSKFNKERTEDGFIISAYNKDDKSIEIKLNY